jgi:hypothetical protein
LQPHGKKHVKRRASSAGSSAEVRWIETKLEDSIENYHKDQPRNHWRRAAGELIAGLLKGHHKKTRMIKMMKPNGTLTRNQEESAKVFKDHCFRKERIQATSIEVRSLAMDTIFDEIDPIPYDLNTVKNHGYYLSISL